MATSRSSSLSKSQQLQFSDQKSRVCVRSLKSDTPEHITFIKITSQEVSLRLRTPLLVSARRSHPNFACEIYKCICTCVFAQCEWLCGERGAECVNAAVRRIIFDTQKEICELVACAPAAAAINITAGNYFGVRLECLLQESKPAPAHSHNPRTHTQALSGTSDLRLRTFNCAPIRSDIKSLGFLFHTVETINHKHQEE